MKLPVKLQTGEEVKLVVRRAPASLMAVWAAEVLVIGAFILLIALLGASMGTWESKDDMSGGNLLVVLMVLLILGAIGSGLIGTYLNFKNKMFFTNKRVIYEKMPNLLAKEVKVIRLSEIEDASFKKEGILAMIFGFGTLRLSTESDETMYVFPYCSTPQSEIETITDLIAENHKTKK